jgi:uncharacterized protein (UPF0335 family)
MSAHVDYSGDSIVNAGHLRAFIERIEKLQEERKALSDDIAEIYFEVKSFGYDAKVVREIVKIRTQDRDKRHEHDEILSMYLSALGIE